MRTLAIGVGRALAVRDSTCVRAFGLLRLVAAVLRLALSAGASLCPRGFVCGVDRGVRPDACGFACTR